MRNSILEREESVRQEALALQETRRQIESYKTAIEQELQQRSQQVLNQVNEVTQIKDSLNLVIQKEVQK